MEEITVSIKKKKEDIKYCKKDMELCPCYVTLSKYV
jgi:hypothetical protein